VKSTLSVMNIDGSNVRSLGVLADIGKTIWIDNSHILVATFDPATKEEALFKFNVDTKQREGFSMPLKQTYVRELEISNKYNFLYFVANDRLYIMGL
jgi:hypothetical protein